MTDDNILEALSRVPTELSAKDIDTIIAFYQKSKREYDAGVKPKKEGADINLIEILGIPPIIPKTADDDRRD